MIDALTRALRTYAQSLCGLLLAAWGPLIDVSTIRACAVAAIPAALAAVMNALETKTPVNLGPRG